MYGSIINNGKITLRCINTAKHRWYINNYLMSWAFYFCLKVNIHILDSIFHMDHGDVCYNYSAYVATSSDNY